MVWIRTSWCGRARSTVCPIELHGLDSDRPDRNRAGGTLYGIPKRTNSIRANAITRGDSVLVLGMVNGPAITASKVIVQIADKCGSAISSAIGVVPFQRGAPSAAKQVGQIPANYSQGRELPLAEQKRIRRPKLRWLTTRGTSSTGLWNSVTANTRFTTSASTGRTTSSSATT